ncbi:MAG: hypothetical protein NVS2B12_39200 [Ktedonobacteraceae bacterium]
MQAPLETAPAVIEQADTLMIYDIATLINAVYQLTIEPTKEGRVPKRIAKKLYPVLKGMERSYYLEDNDEYLDMLFEIMEAMHLVRKTRPPVDSMKSRLQPGDRLSAWGDLDVEWQTRVLLEHWQKEVRWDDVGELAFSSTVFGDESSFDAGNRYRFDSWDLAFSTDNLAGRTTLLMHLRQYIPGQWYSVDTLLRDIWQVSPLGARQSMSAQMRKLEERKVRASYEKWYNNNALNYVCMLNSSLHELGIVDLGYEKSDEEDPEHTPQAFRITPLGTEVLKEAKRHPLATPPEISAPATAHTLIVQPNFEILLLQPDMPTLYSILPFTQMKQISTASQLMLSQATLHRGIAAGKTVTQVIQILEQHTQKELPQNVLYTLQDWARLYKETRLSMVMLIETPNEQVTRQIAGLERFQRWNAREIAPCILALDGDANLQEVRNALEKTGVTINLVGAFPRVSKSNERYY